MLYLVHDEQGKITQATQVFDPTPEYEARLADLAPRHIKVKSNGLLSHELWMASTRKGSIVPLHKRPPMRVAVSNRLIKAGGNDPAIITGAPKNVKYRVSVQGNLVWPMLGDPDVLPDGELELSVPTPGFYRVELELWPYQSFAVNIEAVP